VTSLTEVPGALAEDGNCFPGREVDADEVTAFVKARIGSVKTPKEIRVWTDLPRSKVGKVLKTEIRSSLLEAD